MKVAPLPSIVADALSLEFRRTLEEFSLATTFEQVSSVAEASLSITAFLLSASQAGYPKTFMISGVEVCVQSCSEVDEYSHVDGMEPSVDYSNTAPLRQDVVPQLDGPVIQLRAVSSRYRQKVDLLVDTQGASLHGLFRILFILILGRVPDERETAEQSSMFAVATRDELTPELCESICAYVINSSEARSRETRWFLVA